MWRPEVIASSARAAPIRRGARWVPPAAGITPRWTSGRPTRPPAWAMRQWAAMATSSPPPSAVPCRVATTGFEAASIRSHRAEICGSFRFVPNSVMSAPAWKVRPAQWITATWADASASKRSIPAKIPARTSFPSALTGGLSVRITATPSRTS